MQTFRHRCFHRSLLLGIIVATLYKLVDELQTSRMQAARLSKIAREMRFAVETGSALKA